MRIALLIILVFVPVFVFVSSAEAGERTRSEFAKVLGSIKTGMTSAQIVSLLGRPDDIVQEGRTTEWRYGTDGHLSFPTFGCIYLNEDKVEYVSGGDGAPLSSDLFTEADLRSLLPKIDDTSTTDPLSTIQVVNLLEPLGKEKALAVVKEYLRVSSHDNPSLFLILRALFEIPAVPGYLSPPGLGAPEPREPPDPKVFPRFPLALIDDVPLYLVWGYELFGEPESTEEDIQYLQDGIFRATPLNPTNDPLSLLNRLEATPNWGSTWEAGIEKHHLASQLLRLIRTVYRIPPEDDDQGEWFVKYPFDQKRWDGIVKDVQALHIKWDPVKNCYTFPDGTTLPPLQTKPLIRLNLVSPTPVITIPSHERR